jgi:hypothetical protein
VSHGLATYHLATVRQSWVGRDAKLTGREMRAATTHLENAARWSGATVERAGREITSDTLRMSERLVHGAAAVPEDVGRSIDPLGGEVDRIGREMTTPVRVPSRPQLNASIVRPHTCHDRRQFPGGAPWPNT